MSRRRQSQAILIVLGLFTAGLVALSVGETRKAGVSVTPLGKIPAGDRTARFMVGVTNDSRFKMECLVCRVTAPLPDEGSSSQFRRVVIPSKSGTVVEISLKGVRCPWTLEVVYQRCPGRVEHFLRRVGRRLGFCEREPARQKGESIEILDF